MKSIVSMEHVSKRFKEQKAVADLTLDIREGSITALLGPNGAGKTTSISMMLGLLRPTSGVVRVMGGNPQDPEVKQSMGAMLQDISVMDRLKVGETVDLFRQYYKHPLPLKRLLDIAGLNEVRTTYATSLSGGQKRRLDFALAMAGNPKLLFLDEPTVGMDVSIRQQFWDTIRELAAEGRTILLTTHYLEEADRLADRIVIINKGQKVADGTPQEIKAQRGKKTITFAVGERDAAAKEAERILSALPGIADSRREGRKFILTSRDTDRLIYDLVRSGLEMQDIGIDAGGLEDAFQFLLQEETKS